MISFIFAGFYFIYLLVLICRVGVFGLLFLLFEWDLWFDVCCVMFCFV